jgi:hypothetical protein
MVIIFSKISDKPIEKSFSRNFNISFEKINNHSFMKTYQANIISTLDATFSFDLFGILVLMGNK